MTLLDFSGNYPVYDAALRVHAGYAQVQSEILPGISLDAGVRYEHGRQSVTGVDVYSTGVTPSQQIREEYWLPAATLTVEAAKDVQLRLSASKRSEEHTSELQSLMRISYAVFCLKKNK